MMCLKHPGLSELYSASYLQTMEYLNQGGYICKQGNGSWIRPGSIKARCILGVFFSTLQRADTRLCVDHEGKASLVYLVVYRGSNRNSLYT